MTTASSSTSKTLVKKENMALGKEEAGFVLERRAAAHASTLISISLVQGEEPITLRVQGQDDQELLYKTGVKVPLRFLMMDYCSRKGFAYGTIRFLFDGRRIKGYQTPQDLEMQEDDTIDAFCEQLSGSGCC